VAATEGAALTTSDSALTASEGAILTIADAANMALSVEIDELDVAAISPGLETEVEIDAIEGETFKGSVASVSEDATVENGVAKYTATIEIERSDAMKAGLSATATITKEKREGVVTIPLAAVQEFGDRVFVYTSLDGDTGAPAGEQEIETGLSDGTNVEVVSGLNEGDTVYYTPAASDEDAQAQMMFPGMMGGDTRGMADRGTPPAGGGTRPSGSDSSGGAPAAPGGN
jgi:multidrug efflux pump subunit AcrA (membrane-fusion protein)